ncbi:retrovirus-related pol polyprotein from transposon TNT 1-94 [Tanacetum coccineum]
MDWLQRFERKELPAKQIRCIRSGIERSRKHVMLTGLVECRLSIDLNQEAEYMALTEAVKESIIKGYMLAEIVKSKEIEVAKIGTKDNAADAFTKVVPVPYTSDRIDISKNACYLVTFPLCTTSDSQHLDLSKWCYLDHELDKLEFDDGCVIQIAKLASLEEDAHEPITFQEAINSSEKDEWKPRYKARVVARGFTQRAGIDYNEVFSPVVRHTSITVILSLTVCEDYELEQLDVKTAFLHGNLEETIYMRQPPCFEEGTCNKVCLLKKSLYGLKQSPRQWYKRFNVYMISNGFSRNNYDSCVYFKEFAQGMYIYLLLYVDDTLIACKSKSEIEYTKGLLRKEFDMKELGPAKKILGIEIVRDKGSQTLKVSQSGYVQKILNNYLMDNGKSVYVPLGAHFKVSLKDCPPDIAYAFSIVSRYLGNPGKNYWEAVKWILKYLKGTADVGLVYGRDQGKHVDVDGLVDADYAKDPNKEAEYMALTEAVKESIIKGYMLASVVVNYDNQSAIHLSRNTMFHERTKHINVRYHFIREIVKSKEIEVAKIGTKNNAADAFTKVVPGPKFKYCMKILVLGLTSLVTKVEIVSISVESS